MAKESYDSESLWDKAGDDDNYGVTRCEECHKMVGYYMRDDDSKTRAMKEHYKTFHRYTNCPYGNDNSDGNNDESSTTSSEGTTIYIKSDIDNNYAGDVVDIDDVASVLDELGVCGAEWFKEEYNSYVCNYVYDNLVEVTIMDGFIRRKFSPQSMTLASALINNRSVMMFVTSSYDNVLQIDGMDYIVLRTIPIKGSNSYGSCYYAYFYVI